MAKEKVVKEENAPKAKKEKPVKSEAPIKEVEKPIIPVEEKTENEEVNNNEIEPASVSSAFVEEIPHEITEEDLENNPDLKGEVEVGEIIGIPVDSIVEKEEVIFPITGAILSDQAIKWKKYLQLQKITPEKFLEKYQNHPSRKWVEELIIK